MISQAALDFYKGKRAIVTGGSGLIGRQVVDLLVGAGAEVFVVSLDDVAPNPNVQYKKADLRYFDEAQKAMIGMDCVFHLAGIKGSPQVTKEKPASFFAPLLQMNTNVLEAVRKLPIEHFVYTSSIGAYSPAEVLVEGENEDGQPMDSYPGWAKRMAEMQIQSYRIQYGLTGFSVVRPSNVYGPGDNFDPENAMFIGSLIHKVHNHLYGNGDPVVIWGDGSPIRDFTFSKDLAEGILLTMFHSPLVPYLNLGNPVSYSVRDVVMTLRDIIPFEPVFDTDKPNGFPRRIMSCKKAQQLVEYSPSVSLAEGLKQTWEWYVSHPAEYLQRQNYFTQKESRYGS